MCASVACFYGWRFQRSSPQTSSSPFGFHKDISCEQETIDCREESSFKLEDVWCMVAWGNYLFLDVVHLRIWGAVLVMWNVWLLKAVSWIPLDFLSRISKRFGNNAWSLVGNYSCEFISALDVGRTEVEFVWCCSALMLFKAEGFINLCYFHLGCLRQCFMPVSQLLSILILISG